MSAQNPFFTFSCSDDTTMIYYAAQDALRKRRLGARLNFKESGLVICQHIMEEAEKGRSVKEIVSSSRKLLKADEVMPGVPEIMRQLVVNVEFKDGETREVVVKQPIKPEE
jgi:urease gamma subunit